MKKWITVLLTLALAAGLLGAVPAAAKEEQPDLSALDALLETLTGLRDAVQAGETELTDEMMDVLNGLAEQAGELTALLQPAEAEEPEEPAQAEEAEAAEEPAEAEEAEEPAEPEETEEAGEPAPAEDETAEPAEAEAAEEPAEAEETEEPAETEEAEEAAEDPFEGLMRLGEETDTCVMVKLTNMSESDNIMMINIKRSDDWQWSENLLAEDDTLDVNESAVLCFEPAEPEEAEDEEEEQPVTYDLQIIYEGWTGGSCHNVPLEDVKDAQIMRAWNSIPYLVYTSIATDEEVDMEDAEQQIALAEFYANAQTQSSSGSSSSGGSFSSGSSSSGSSSSGSSEGCIGSSGLLY